MKPTKKAILRILASALMLAAPWFSMKTASAVIAYTVSYSPRTDALSIFFLIVMPTVLLNGIVTILILMRRATLATRFWYAAISYIACLVLFIWFSG